MAAELRNNNLSFAITMGALSIYLIGLSFSYPADSALFPRVLSLLLLVVTAIFARRHLRRRNGGKAVAETRTGLHPIAWLAAGAGNAVVLFFCGTALYVYMISVLGFFSSTMLYVVINMLLLGMRKLSVIVLWPIAFAFILFVTFRIVLKAPVPSGILF